MTRIWTLSLFLVTLTTTGLAPNIKAATMIDQTFSGSLPATITGSLPTRDTALLEMFTLPSSSDVTVTTTSYASGGFEPNLLLYNSMGNFINAGIPFGQPDPNSGIVGDMQLTAPGFFPNGVNGMLNMSSGPATAANLN